jgi:hypothetical protein
MEVLYNDNAALWSTDKEIATITSLVGVNKKVRAACKVQVAQYEF